MSAPPVLGLVPGVKRRAFRQGDPRSDVADAGLKAKRPGVLAKAKYTCAACHYQAKLNHRHLDVHHLNDDHQDNGDTNLAAACHTCHPYQHVGEVARRTDGMAESMGNKTLFAHIPEIGPADMNLLQRAIGVALLNEASRDEASDVLSALLDRADVTKDVFGSWHAKDFAGAMAGLSEAEYAKRRGALEDQRLMFSEGLLKTLGAEFVADYPSQPVHMWEQIASRVTQSGAA